MVGCVEITMYKLCLNAFLLWEGAVAPCLIFNKLAVLAMWIESVTSKRTFIINGIVESDYPESQIRKENPVWHFVCLHSRLRGDVLNYLNTLFLKAFNSSIPFPWPVLINELRMTLHLHNIILVYSHVR